jgi:putative NADH-flavin reductase
MPSSRKCAALRLVLVLICSILTAEPLVADELANDIEPQKIVVFGASGRVGSRVVHEALSRGHQVTAVSRDPAWVSRQEGRVMAVQGDILDTDRVEELISEQDVIVVSLRGSVDKSKDPKNSIQRVAAELLVETLRGLDANVPRLIYVGGAGSLEVEPGVMYAESISGVARIFMPRRLRQEIIGQVLTLEYLRTVDDVCWTYVSPAKKFEPGERLGKYRIGGDMMLKKDKGESIISMEDFALALIDEVEDPQHCRVRFSVAY